MSGTLTIRDSPPPKAWPLSLSSAGVPGSEAATSLSAPPVALPQQQTREERKVLLIKTVRIVHNHQKVITTFQGSKDKQRIITKNRLPRVLNASSRDAVMHTYTAFSFPLNVQQAHLHALHSHSYTRQHTLQHSALLQYDARWCPHTAVPCTAVNIQLLLAIFREGDRNVFHWLADKHNI